MIYNIKPILIKTKTNLHVGSDSNNFDIVDKSVQRDSISNLPIINSSSLKGALKDFMYNFIDDKTTTTDKLKEEAYNKIFGSEEKQNGLTKFLDSYLLFLPLRSDKKPYFHVTSKENLLSCIDFFENLGYKNERFEKAKEVIEKLKDNTVLDNQKAVVEDVECEADNTDIKIFLNLLPSSIKVENIAIFSNENFNDAISHLPVIARNKLKNGVSENLWYEEMVPRESIFYTAFLEYDNFGNSSKDSYKNGYKAFWKILTKNLIQVGANASIGFGLCDFMLLDKEESKNEQ